MGSKSYCHFVILSFSEKYVQILLTYHYLYLCNVIPRNEEREMLCKPSSNAMQINSEEPTVAGRIENRRPKGTNGLCRKAGKEKSKATGRRRKVRNQRSLSHGGESNREKQWKEGELSSMQAIVQTPRLPNFQTPLKREN